MLKKIFFIAILLVLLVSGSYFVYLWATYINNTVTSGEAYGFKINESKRDVFLKAKEIFKDTELYILYPLNKLNVGPHKRVFFQEDDYFILQNRDNWKFYFDKGVFNSLKLKFEGDRLVRIHRHRKNFEAP